MALKIAHHIAVHIIAHHGIADTVKGYVGIVVLHEFAVGGFDSLRLQPIDVLRGDFLLCLVFLFRMYGDRLQHTACRRDTDISQLPSDRQFQLFLHLGDRVADSPDIVNLAVQHGSGLMLPHTLCHHIELISLSVPHCPDDASRSDIQSEHELSGIFLYFSHRYSPIFFSICLYVSSRATPLSITVLQCALYSASESCDRRIF